MVMSRRSPGPRRYCTPARPASHVRNASVDVLRRMRRNAYTIRGAAPDLNHRTSVPRIARERVPTIATRITRDFAKLPATVPAAPDPVRRELPMAACRRWASFALSLRK